MKLSKIYTDLPQYFKPINFNDGLNVILGKVTQPKNANKDSHNLGKSLLIDIIDYCLLKKNSSNSFTNNLPQNLARINFFLELILKSGNFLTVKRGIENNTKICFKESTEGSQDLSKSNESEWDYYNLAFEKSKEFLDGKLSLTAISPFNYRHGISYFLRKQRDYSDIFQIEKFSQGKHLEWNPYIGQLLGFTSKYIKDKYSYDQKIKSKSEELSNLKNKLIHSDEALDKLRARKEAEEQRVKKMEGKLDSFDFKERDLQISEIDLKEIEEKISYINNEIYNLNNDLSEIEKSINSKIAFKIDNIKRIFEDAGISFKGPLLKDYKDLENFNIKLTKDRKKNLQQQKEKIKNNLNKFKTDLENLNSDRVLKLEAIREKDSFKKYKIMQNDLVRFKGNLQELDNDLGRYQEIKKKESELNEIEKNISATVSKIKNEIQNENNTLSSIRSFFRELADSVLKKVALFYVDINEASNIDFFAHYTEDENPTSPTSEGKGTSYRKLLCIFFDLAILRYYTNKEFYRFVYHDGILEGLDDRKKISFINTIRRYTQSYGIQYILTVIDSDMPYTENGKKFNFSEKEVVKELTDEGDQGRLFNCPIF